MENEQKHQIINNNSALMKSFFIDILDCESELKRIFESKEKLIAIIEKFIYNENHQISVYSQKFQESKIIEKYNITKFQLNILKKKIDKLLSFLKSENLIDSIKLYFYLYWINLVDYRKCETIYLSMHMTVNYQSKSNFHVYIRLNGEESHENFLSFSIENLNSLLVDNKNNHNSNLIKNNFEANSDLKIKCKLKEFYDLKVKGNIGLLDENNNHSSFIVGVHNESFVDKNKDYNNDCKEIKEIFVFDNNRKLIEIEKESICDGDFITEKESERIFKVDFNKIRGEKQIEKVISNHDLAKKQKFPNNKNSSSSHQKNQKMQLEKKLYKDFTSEWYEIYKTTKESSSFLVSNELENNENNNFINLQISKSNKIFNENLINYERFNENSSKNYNQLHQNYLSFVYSKDNPNLLIHSYGIRNSSSEVKGDKEEKWWKWDTAEFTENKANITISFKAINDDFAEEIKFDKKSKINFFNENIKNINNNTSKNTETSETNTHNTYTTKTNNINNNNFIFMSYLSSNNLESENKLCKDDLVFIYSGNKKLKKKNSQLVEYEYEFEDTCVFKKQANTYETSKKGYDKQNSWQSNYFEDKNRQVSKCENFGFELSSESEWFETWSENPNSKSARKVGKNKNLVLNNNSWSESWREVYHENGLVSKSCSKNRFFDDGRLQSENSWGDVLVDELSCKWMKFSYRSEPYENTKYEFFK